MAASCWGNTILYFAAIAALISLLLFYSNKTSEKIILFVFLISILCDSSIAACSSIIGILLIITGLKKEAACFLGAQLPLLLSPLIKLPTFLLHPLSTLFFYSTIYVVCHALPTCKLAIVKGIIIVYGGILASLTFISWELNPVISPTAPGYKIGNAISKLTNKEIASTGKLIYNQQRFKEVDASGTLYLDHDANCQWDEGNFQQNRPWGNNFPIGSELLRKSILKDGTWICNIGASLKHNKGFFIGGLFQNGIVYPIIIRHNDNLILGDSDFVVDCLAPYQKNLINYITGSDKYTRFFHLSCATCLILSCFFTNNLFVILLCIANLLLMCFPYHGDVRYVGKSHKWAHTDLGEGIVRVLQQQGANVIFGNSNTRLLVIGEGYSATIKTEKIVLLEPGATVKINNTNYRADTIPLGTKNGVIDARNLIIEDEKTSSCILHIGDITLIATGTPTAQTKDLIWPF